MKLLEDRDRMNNLMTDSPPDSNASLLFKISTKERLNKMQNGLIYMNSLDYFASLEDSSNVMDTRADPHENIHAIIRSSDSSNIKYKMQLDCIDYKIDLGENAVISAKYDNTKNTVIFSMGCLGYDENGVIYGETNEGVILSEKFKEFGDHILIIENPAEFTKRYFNATQRKRGLYKPKYIHNGLGRVKYISIYSYSGPLGTYSKDIRFDWQMEFRLAVGAKDSVLNSNGALELYIGDISDITKIAPLDTFLETPLKIKKFKAQKVGDKYFALKKTIM